MLLYPHEFELYHGWILKIASDMESLISSKIRREQIEAIKITDYSNDSGTMTKAYATITVKSDTPIVIPKDVRPTSTNVYENKETKEVVTTLNYVFDIDIERGV
jgi:hypothetical protein